MRNLDADLLLCEEAGNLTIPGIALANLAHRPVFMRLLVEAPAGWADAIRRLKALEAAITEHHGQRADDRCIEDDDRLYAAAGLPPCDRRVGSLEEMHANC